MNKYILYDAYVGIKNSQDKVILNLYYSVVKILYNSILETIQTEALKGITSYTKIKPLAIMDGGMKYHCIISEANVIFINTGILNFDTSIVIISKEEFENILIGAQLNA